MHTYKWNCIGIEARHFRMMVYVGRRGGKRWEVSTLLNHIFFSSKGSQGNMGQCYISVVGPWVSLILFLNFSCQNISVLKFSDNKNIIINAGAAFLKFWISWDIQIEGSSLIFNKMAMKFWIPLIIKIMQVLWLTLHQL